MSQAYLVLLILAAALGVLSRPSGVPRTVHLTEVLNRTTCPMVEDYDENPDRVPRKIKILKCAPEPKSWCEVQNIPDNECCGHSHHGHVMECVEIRDTVLVYNKLRKKTESLGVSVGCTCMVGRSTHAPSLQQSPS